MPELEDQLFLQLHFKCLYAVGSDGYIQLVLVEVSTADLFFRTVCKYCLLYFTGEGDGCLLRSCASCFIYTYYIFIGYFQLFSALCKRLDRCLNVQKQILYLVFRHVSDC